MSDWINVTSAAALCNGAREQVVLDDGTAVLVVAVEDSYFAVADLCTHESLSLAEGEVEGSEIVCPFHGARFCIKSGEALSPPAFEPLETYPVRVTDGVVQIQIPSA